MEFTGLATFLVQIVGIVTGRRARKACRREVKRSLKGLSPSQMDAIVTIRHDDMAWRWLSARCAVCGGCPKFVERAGLTPPPPSPPVEGHLRAIPCQPAS